MYISFLLVFFLVHLWRRRGGGGGGVFISRGWRVTRGGWRMTRRFQRRDRWCRKYIRRCPENSWLMSNLFFYFLPSSLALKL